jgi:dihydroflavonol-4-reductase
VKTLVTGATGFLGSAIIERLPPGATRALVRRRTRLLETRGVEQVIGDVEDMASVKAAMEGVDRVYHLAGLVSRDAKDATRLMRVHVDGTRNVLRAAKDAGVGRLVLASSSGTIAVSKDPVVTDERAPFAFDVVKAWPYYLSKIFQEELALEFWKKEGLPIVIVSPSLLLGPGDERGSSTEDVLRFLRKKIPALTDGGVSFVDVRDAADAFLAAMEQGKPGERYLLGGPNWTVETFFGRLSRIAKVPAPKVKLPEKLALFGAGLLEGIAKWRGVEPPIDRVSVEMGQHYWYLDAGKARRELGFTTRDPQETLLDTVRYLKQKFLGEDAGIEIGGAE